MTQEGLTPQEKAPKGGSLATQYPTLQNYLALQNDPKELARVIQENLQGQQLTPFDLDRVKVPTGGGATFEVPSLEGTEAAKSIQGILLHFTSPRAYWAKGLDEGAEAGPPDCFSPDGNYGRGDPGGPCETCPMNQWDSGKNGRGKGCKEKRMLFMLQPDSYLPMVIQVPTMSIGNLKQYMMRLASRGVPYWGVITELSLSQAQQAGGGLKYSQVTPAMAKDGRLNETETARVKQLADAFKPLLASPSFAQVQPDAEDLGLRDDAPYINDEDPAYDPYHGEEQGEEQDGLPF